MISQTNTLKNLLAAAKYFACWMLFFFVDRLIFILYFLPKTTGISFAEISRSFVVGLRMDASMAAYICALPLLFFIFNWLVKKVTISTKVLKVYSYILVVLFSFIAVVNFNIYREWGSKINYKALDYAFTAPNEAIASSASSPWVSSLLICVCFAAVFVWFFAKMIKPAKPSFNYILKPIFVVLLMIGLDILAIRGGTQLAPMNESMSYFSNKPFVNHATLNTDWYLMNDIIKNKFSKYGHKNPYLYFTNDEAKRIVQELYTNTDTTSQQIFTTNRPNVVIIIMESFTADVVESLGGLQGVNPNMEQMISKGILFTHAYASGDRTDKGTIAVLSGFPSQAVNSIIKSDDKQKKLPSIAQQLALQGYHNSFYYGGESEFVNTKSYLLSHAYTSIIDKKSFDKKDMNSKWGAYDEVVFNRQLQDMKNQMQPFFSTILTLTNHEPFETPLPPHFGNKTTVDKFKSTAYYADSCIGDYMRKAAKEPWFKNTVFVLVADHGHPLPKSTYEINDHHRFRIPILFFGGAIKPEWQGKKMEMLANQTDIAATILCQLQLPINEFVWSKDLFTQNPKQFTFYDWDNGFGFATPQQIISFDNVGKSITYRKEPASKNVDDSLAKYGKAMMQTIYQQYLDY